MPEDLEHFSLSPHTHCTALSSLSVLFYSSLCSLPLMKSSLIPRLAAYPQKFSLHLGFDPQAKARVLN